MPDVVAQHDVKQDIEVQGISIDIKLLPPTMTCLLCDPADTNCFACWDFRFRADPLSLFEVIPEFDSETAKVHRTLTLWLPAHRISHPWHAVVARLPSLWGVESA